MDSLGEDAETEGEPLVLSTIHQAKGLEWSRVIVPRLVEHGFPGDRSLAEAGGEDEERRVFYVAVTRAMDELWLTYPLMVSRPGQGSILTSPSRFITEIDPRPLRGGRRRERERPRLDRRAAGLIRPGPIESATGPSREPQASAGLRIGRPSSFAVSIHSAMTTSTAATASR